MFPTKSRDAYINNNGTRTTLGNKIGSGGGGSDLPEYSQADAGKVLKVGDDGDLEWDEPDPGITWLTAQQWNALTFEEQKALGFTAIGTEGDSYGNYCDYSSLDALWRINSTQSNILDFFMSGAFSFHGFYSNTIGDVVASNGRGGTRSNAAKAVITGYTEGNYGGFAMFALSASDLQCSDTSFYDIFEVDDYGIYVGGNFNGGWSGTPQVSLTHDGVTQNLQNIFTGSEYTIPIVRVQSKMQIDTNYSTVMSGIIDYLNSI